MADPLVLYSQRGFRHCTGQPIFTDQQCVGRPNSIYCCSLILYLICFIMFFDNPFIIMVYIVYLIYIFLN